MLGEDVRRRLYEVVRAARRPVSRDEAAAAVGISRKLAAFHLDKLADAGLLRFRFDSRGARTVGRKPKVYEPADTAVQVSIPARRHELLAEILVRAVVSEGERETARTAAVRSAYERGHAVGATERDRLRPSRLGPERALTLAEEILGSFGFEPGRPRQDCVRLRNCLFQPIAAAEPELVCGLNHAFIRGLLEGLKATAVNAVLAPVTGECCVELRHHTPA